MPGIQPVPLDRFRDEVFALYEPPNMSRNSYNNIRHVFVTLEKIPSLKSTADLTPAVIPQFLEAWGDGNERARLAVLQHLRRVCHLAIDLGYLASSPFAYNILAKAPRHGGKKGRDLDEDEVNRVLEHMKGNANTWKGCRLYALGSTIRYMHFFKSEVLYLKVQDCDLVNATIRLKHGRRSPSEFPIPAELVPILEEWIPLAGQEWLFPNSLSRATPWTTCHYPYAANHQIKQAGDDAGVAHVTFEALRRFRKDEYEATFRRLARPEDRGRAKAKPRVVIGRNHEDQPTIGGTPKRSLSFAQYNVVHALLLAGDQHLTITELDEKSGHNQARTILWKLKRSDPDWDEVIHFPGKNGQGGYWIG